jgi:hypothetical protein
VVGGRIFFSRPTYGFFLLLKISHAILGDEMFLFCSIFMSSTVKCRLANQARKKEPKKLALRGDRKIIEIGSWL